MTLDLSRIDALVVNPSRALQQLLKQVLWDVGVRRLRALPGGGGAFEEMRDQPPDLIFVDMALSDGAGTALVRHLRRAPESPAPFVPVVMTMADPTLAKTLAARDSGADEVVTRPITVTGVVQRLTSISRRPRGIILSRGYVGPDRRRTATMPPKGQDRRNPMRRGVFDLAPMPLLAMIQGGEREAAERMIADARRVLRDLRLAWIDEELDQVREALARIRTARDLAAGRPLLLERIAAVQSAMVEHGYPAAAAICTLLVQILAQRDASERTARLLQVNLESLRALLRARPAEAEQQAREIATNLRAMTGIRTR